MKVKLILFVALAAFVLLAFPMVAAAHALDGAFGAVAQLAHQVFGLHHTPFLPLAAAVGIVLIARAKSRRDL